MTLIFRTSLDLQKNLGESAEFPHTLNLASLIINILH